MFAKRISKLCDNDILSILIVSISLKFLSIFDDLINCCPILPRHPVIDKLIFLIYCFQNFFALSKKLLIKAVQTAEGHVHTTEVWDCTDEEHDSNGWGVIPQALQDEKGIYATPDHLEIDPAEYE